MANDDRRARPPTHCMVDGPLRRRRKLIPTNPNLRATGGNRDHALAATVGEILVFRTACQWIATVGILDRIVRDPGAAEDGVYRLHAGENRAGLVGIDETRLVRWA